LPTTVDRRRPLHHVQSLAALGDVLADSIIILDNLATEDQPLPFNRSL
jgi:hypothetical protein